MESKEEDDGKNGVNNILSSLQATNDEIQEKELSSSSDDKDCIASSDVRRDCLDYQKDVPKCGPIDDTGHKDDDINNNVCVQFDSMVMKEENNIISPVAQKVDECLDVSVPKQKSVAADEVDVLSGKFDELSVKRCSDRVAETTTSDVKNSDSEQLHNRTSQEYSAGNLLFPPKSPAGCISMTESLSLDADAKKDIILVPRAPENGRATQYNYLEYDSTTRDGIIAYNCSVDEFRGNKRMQSDDSYYHQPTKYNRPDSISGQPDMLRQVYQGSSITLSPQYVDHAAAFGMSATVQSTLNSTNYLSEAQSINVTGSGHFSPPGQPVYSYNRPTFYQPVTTSFSPTGNVFNSPLTTGPAEPMIEVQTRQGLMTGGCRVLNGAANLSGVVTRTSLNLCEIGSTNSGNNQLYADQRGWNSDCNDGGFYRAYSGQNNAIQSNGVQEMPGDTCDSFTDLLTDFDPLPPMENGLVERILEAERGGLQEVNFEEISLQQEQRNERQHKQHQNQYGLQQQQSAPPNNSHQHELSELPFVAASAISVTGHGRGESMSYPLPSTTNIEMNIPETLRYSGHILPPVAERCRLSSSNRPIIGLNLQSPCSTSADRQSPEADSGVGETDSSKSSPHPSYIDLEDPDLFPGCLDLLENPDWDPASIFNGVESQTSGEAINGSYQQFGENSNGHLNGTGLSSFALTIPGGFGGQYPVILEDKLQLLQVQVSPATVSHATDTHSRPSCNGVKPEQRAAPQVLRELKPKPPVIQQPGGMNTNSEQNLKGPPTKGIYPSSHAEEINAKLENLLSTCSRPSTAAMASRSSERTGGSDAMYHRKTASLEKKELLNPDEDGDLLLHIAVVNGVTGFVAALLDRCDREGITKTIIDHPNNRMQTPLSLAVARNHTDIVRVLIEHGADVNRQSQYQHGSGTIYYPPLHSAAVHGPDGLPTLLQLLRCRNIKLDDLSSEGRTALHRAIEEHGTVLKEAVNQSKAPTGSNGTTVDRGCGRVVIDSRLIMYNLVIHGADINAADTSSGRTPLHYVVEKKNPAFLDWFLKLVSLVRSKAEMDYALNSDGGSCTPSARRPLPPTLHEVVNKRTAGLVTALDLAAGHSNHTNGTGSDVSEVQIAMIALLLRSGAELGQSGADSVLKKRLRKIPQISHYLTPPSRKHSTLRHSLTEHN